MPKKTKISQEDLDAFLSAIKGTKPILQGKVKLGAPISTHKPKKNQPTPKKDLFSFNESLETDPVRGEQFIAYKHASVANKILRKLRKGQYNVDAILDLHGMTVEKAKTALDRFLHQCLHEGMRVVLIIHGKGHHSQMPILKNKLNHWLRTIDVVLAFCSALPSHGSGGATYVLLKRMTEENSFG